MKTIDKAVLALMQRVSRDIILPRFRNLEASEIEDKGKNERTGTVEDSMLTSNEPEVERASCMTCSGACQGEPVH